MRRENAAHAAALALMAVLAGCEGDAAPPAAETTQVVDSIVPIPEEIRRFRADVGPGPAALAGAPTRDALVAEFVRAVEAADTAALRALPLTGPEFIDLYYPFTRFVAKPYELAPDLFWFQIQNEQSRGLFRLLDRYAGQPLGSVGYRCEEPRVEGPNQVWDACVLRLLGAAGDTVSVRMFGTVLERDGAFRLVSLANDL